MSEAVHGSTLSLEALVAEVQAEYHHRDTEDFTPSSYLGLQSAANRRRMKHKHATSEYVKVTGGIARRLNSREVEELQRHIAWLRGESLPLPAVRKAVV